MRRQLKITALTGLLTALLLSPSAHAYLDPGTGSLIIQGAIAAVGAVLVGARLYWARIKLWFRGAIGSEEESKPDA